jgi:hypothetical protein
MKIHQQVYLVLEKHSKKNGLLPRAEEVVIDLQN